MDTSPQMWKLKCTFPFDKQLCFKKVEPKEIINSMDKDVWYV